MSSYGNRGMTFESLIEYANRRYRLDGKAIIEKQHTLCKPLRDGTGRIYSAKYEEKATVDFMGRFGGKPIAFEAKHCQTQKIDLKRVEEHQCDFLRDWTKPPAGAIGFVIISFELSRFFMIPWSYWEAAREARAAKVEDRPMKHIAPSHTWEDMGNGRARVAFNPYETIWETTGKASIRADELPMEWEIPMGGTAGLDYLAKVAEFWGWG